MRYILDDNGYIKSVSFSPIEYNGKTCKEYTGTIPSGYSSLEDWAVNANIAAYKIVDNNLVYDAAKDAEIGEIVAKTSPYNVYSTDERIIGEWIDGKPLYRKIIDIGSLPNCTLKEIDHDISNLDYVVNLRGIATNGDSCILLPRTHTGNVLNIVLEINKTNIIVYDEFDFSPYSAYVIVEYTKI